MRLGEHDTSAEEDCRVKKAKKVCAPAVEDVTPEQVFVHEDYIMNNDFLNDIALIKLSRDVGNYSKYHTNQ